MANSADPDQLASSKAGYIRVQQDKGFNNNMHLRGIDTISGETILPKLFHLFFAKFVFLVKKAVCPVPLSQCLRGYHIYPNYLDTPTPYHTSRI